MCPYCGSSGRKYIEYEEYFFYTCSKCGSGELKQKSQHAHTDQTYNDEYYKTYIFPSSLGRVLKKALVNKPRISALEKLGASGVVLDYGCGDGLFAKAFNPTKWEVYGTDTSSSALKVAESNGINTAYPLKVDVITCVHVLEHIRSVEEVLSTFQDLLKSRGLLYIEVPNYGYFLSKVFGGKWMPNTLESDHVNHFTKMGLTAALNLHGFEMLKQAPNYGQNAVLSSYMLAKTFQPLVGILPGLVLTILAVPLVSIMYFLGEYSTNNVIFRKTQAKGSNYC